MELDDKNNVKCDCGSIKFEKQFSEETAWETLPVKQDDGRVIHKPVVRQELKGPPVCTQCGQEIKEKPEPVLISERPIHMIERK